jgi:putative transposase
LRDLDRAYVNFFEGIAGYPTPRKKGVNDSVRFQGPAVPSWEKYDSHDRAE